MRAALIVAFLLLVVDCGSPTNPTAIRNPGNATPPALPTASPLSDISGNWTGKIVYEYPDDWCTCCIPDFQATATFTQQGTDVAGSVKSMCLDEQFTGSLRNGQLSGTATLTELGTTYDGVVSGEATTSQFLFVNKQIHSGDHGVSGFSIHFSR